MYIQSVGTANPPGRFTKADCLAAFERSEWFAKLDSRAHYIARAVLQRDNGIEARRLAVESLDDVFTIDPNTLALRFLTHAPMLAAQAGAIALARTELKSAQIDAVIVSTCTGYLCPGLSGHVVEHLGLRPDCQTYDLVGQGCAAALPNLMLGNALLASGACENVLSICVEVSSAAMYLDNDPGQRNALMFEQRDGMLRNVLTRAVPELAAGYAQRVLGTVLNRAGLRPDEVATWVMHAGGRDVLQALEKRLNLKPDDLHYSASMLREYGNLSSAFVYFVLQAALADDAGPGWWWLSSFGAGFSCHGALLEVN